MKTSFFGLVALLLGGCVALPYDVYQQQPYPYQTAPPPVQYAPQGCRPGYVMVPWHGCVWPMYSAPVYTGGYYAPMYYGDPLFRFNFNFGGGKKHHGGGRHHRER